MHNENRRSPLRRRTHSKGFTLLELGVAVLVFSLVAGIVTLAVARTQLSAAHSRVRVGVESEIRRLVAVAATGNFDELVDGTFTRPQACDESIHQSCITVLGRAFTVDWDINAVADRTGVSSNHAAGVRISATTDLPDGTDVTVDKFVTPPSGGREGSALLRVRLTGAPYSGPVYLLDDTGAVVGSSLATNDLALIRADATDCSSAPCRLALAPDGTTEHEDIAISYASLVGPAQGIVLSEAAVAETSITVETVTPVQVLLYAENPDGRGAWNHEPGSVCLYLSFTHGGGTVDVPGCNTDQPDRISWKTFPADPADPARTSPLPQGPAITVKTDPTAGYCSAGDQKGWNGSTLTWEPATVCTSWTWGPFDELRPGITAKTAATDASFTLTAGVETYLTAVWAPATATAPSRPAGGSAGDPLWENPRDIPACAATTTCEPEQGTPETGCPDQHCNSSGNRAPVLAAPVTGTYGIAGVSAPAATSTTFTLAFDDNDGQGSITVTATDVPAGLTLSGSPVTNGTVLVNGGGSAASVELTYTADPSFTGTTLELTITDGTTSRTQTVVLSDGTEETHMLHTGPVTVDQNGSTVGRLLAVDTAGEPQTTLTVTDDLPSGISLAAPVHTAGWFTLTYTAADATAGTTTFTLTSGQATTDATDLEVIARTTTLTVSDVTLAQNGSGTVTATATDAAGNPAQGRHVWFTLTGDADTWPLGSILDRRGCLTGSSGTCSVDIDIEVSAVTGVYTIDAASDDAEGSGTLTVTSSLSRVDTTGGTAEQGGSTTLTIRAFDGRNEPAAGVVVSFTSAVTGVSVPATATTDGEGRATITVTTTTSTPAGNADITITSGTFSRTARVLVVQTVDGASTSLAASTIAQGGIRVITVTAQDPQGDPVPYAMLDVTADTGLLVPGSVMTGADGSIALNVASGAAVTIGDYTVTISYESVTLTTVTLTVIPGVSKVDVLGDITADDTSRVSLRLRGADGTPLTGRDVTLEALDSRLTVSAVDSATDATGWARFDITAGTVPGDTYEFVLTVDGREIVIGVQTT